MDRAAEYAIRALAMRLGLGEWETDEIIREACVHAESDRMAHARALAQKGKRQ